MLSKGPPDEAHYQEAPMRAPVRSVLVTGATRGIGRAILEALVRRGTHVACGYSASRTSAQALAREYAGRVLPVHYRLGDRDSATSAIRQTVEGFGRLDGLVLNAGVWAGGRLERIALDDWEAVITENLAGAAQLCRAAFPVLAESRDGSITVVSSVVGLTGGLGDTAYAAAKAGLIGFAKSLAREGARHGMRVNVVAPGFVETDMTARVPASSRNRIQDEILLRRAGSTDEVAAAVVFLSEDATYCTGSVLTVDGGWSL